MGGLTACGGLQPEPTINDLETETLITNTASQAHTFVHATKSNKIICTQPFPDAAFDQEEEGDFSLSFISLGGDESTAVGEGSEEVELAGRTPTVLMTRELFFRACEFAHNFNLEKEEALAIYNKTLETVATVWATEAGNTTVTVGDTVSNATTTALTTAITQSLTAAQEKTDTISATETETTETTTSESN